MAGEETKAASRFCPFCLALAFGLVWGLGMLILGAVTVYTMTYGHKFVEVMGSIYWGFEPGTWKGALLGLGWGFADAFVGTLVVYAIYRLLTCACRCPRCARNRSPSSQS